MRIALIRRMYSLKRGGAERYCVNLTRQLQRLGHDVSIIGEAIDPALQHEVRFVPASIDRSASWTKNRSFADNCAEIIARSDYDIVYALSRVPAADCFRVTDRLHAHWMNVYYRRTWNRWLQHLNPRHRTLLQLEREIYRHDGVARIVTQSRLDSGLVQNYFGVLPHRVRWIANGVDVDHFHPMSVSERIAVRNELGIRRDAPLLVFAAMNFAGKGLTAVLRALMSPACRDCRLLVLGGDGTRCSDQRRAQRWGVADRVIFAGPRFPLKRYLGAGDLFVLPAAYEPFPNVNLESMACGTPILTTTTAGGVDIVQPGLNGYLVTDDQAVDEIAGSVGLFFGQDAYGREEMRKASRETASQYTLERNAVETVSLFREILEEKRQSQHSTGRKRAGRRLPWQAPAPEVLCEL